LETYTPGQLALLAMGSKLLRERQETLKPKPRREKARPPKPLKTMTRKEYESYLKKAGL